MNISLYTRRFQELEVKITEIFVIEEIMFKIVGSVDTKYRRCGLQGAEEPKTSFSGH